MTTEERRAGIRSAVRYVCLIVDVLVFCLLSLYFSLSLRLLMGMVIEKGGILRSIDFIALALCCIFMIVSIALLDRSYARIESVKGIFCRFGWTLGWLLLAMGVIMIPCCLAGSAPRWGGAASIAAGVVLVVVFWRKRRAV